MKTLQKQNFFLIIFLLILVSCNTSKEPWQNLFNGENFEGWEQVSGSASFTIENGEIVTSSIRDTVNSFLSTKQTYSDFILEYEVKVGDSHVNSGVQIRSHSIPEYRNGRVHGCQVEIDASERAYSGGIYDEGRRGWLYPLGVNEDARMAFKLGEWNKFRVEAIGAHIKTWINDVPVANLWDEEDAEGFIALQSHVAWDTVQIGKEVRWKNIRIITENADKYSMESTAPEVNRLANKLTEQEKENDWKLLFDGETTQGWRGAQKDSFPASGWEIKDGILTVIESGGGESTNGGDIVTIDQYSNFDLVVEFKITEGANSGIKYYVTEKEQVNGSSIGPEFQILDDAKHPDAKLGNHEGSRTIGSLYDLIKAENKRVAPVGQWNQARIYSNNNHVEHWLNGFKVLEYERGSEEFRKLVSESKYKVWENFGEAEKGHILLQDHGNRVSFRSIKIKELSE